MNSKPDTPEGMHGSMAREQIAMEARDLLDHVNDSALTERFMQFKEKHPAMVGKAVDFCMKHPLAVKAAATSVGLGYLVSPVAADTFGINTTDIDEAFDLMNQHILPKTGETISAMPAVIIPLVILIVLIMILFIVPELLGTLIDAVRSAIGGAFKH
jgi:hypothetical protein